MTRIFECERCGRMWANDGDVLLTAIYFDHGASYRATVVEQFLTTTLSASTLVHNSPCTGTIWELTVARPDLQAAYRLGGEQAVRAMEVEKPDIWPSAT